MKTVEIQEEYLRYIRAVLGQLSEYDALELLINAKKFTCDESKKEELSKLIESHENDNDYNLRVWQKIDSLINS